MTATLDIEVARADDVLQVPAASLRFTPTEALLSAAGSPSHAGPAPKGAQGSRVWIRTANGLSPVAVEAGLTDNVTGPIGQICSTALTAGTKWISRF